ncbi:MAG: TIGR01777 family protein [Bacteroidales bacterium]|nr:TIGR01777 family protein [Bacteroidales bacterium]
MKKVLIIGASGFIGSALKNGLNNFEINVLRGRSVYEMELRELSRQVDGYDIIINLSGKSIVGLWTKKNRREIYDSRIKTTEKISTAILMTQNPPKHFLNASAIGIYKCEFESDEMSDQMDEGFLGVVVKDWEKASESLTGSTTKRTLIRIGVVIGKEGGAYRNLRKLTSLNLGSVFNGGNQSLSFIDILDLVRAVEFVITNELTGVVNLVSPEYSSYRELARLMKKSTGAWITWNIPGIFIRLILGESSTLFLEGHKIIPSVLLKNSFNFESPNLETCIAKLEGF